MLGNAGHEEALAEQTQSRGQRLLQAQHHHEQRRPGLLGEGGAVFRRGGEVSSTAPRTGTSIDPKEAVDLVDENTIGICCHPRHDLHGRV